MATVLLHYCGLRPEQHTWYNNKRGAGVPVYPGEWVRLDLYRHPEVKHCIETGVAVVKESAPQGTKILDESTYSGGDRLPPGLLERLRSPKPERSTGHPQAYRLTKRQVEKLAKCFLAPKYPAALGIAYVKDYPQRRGPKPKIPALAPTMHPAFARNFAMLCRLAELLARMVPSDPDPGAGWRRRTRLAAILRRWGVWGKEDAPSPSTLNRYRAWLGLSRREIDLEILARFPSECPKCGCPKVGGRTTGVGPPCHRWTTQIACPHCGRKLMPQAERVIFL